MRAVGQQPADERRWERRAPCGAAGRGALCSGAATQTSRAVFPSEQNGGGAGMCRTCGTRMGAKVGAAARGDSAELFVPGLALG